MVDFDIGLHALLLGKFAISALAGLSPPQTDRPPTDATGLGSGTHSNDPELITSRRLCSQDYHPCTCTLHVHVHVQARIQRGLWGLWPPCSWPPNIFFNKLVNDGKKIAPNILWTLYTFISDLKIIRQAVKPPRTSHNHRRIGLKSHLRASRFKNFPGEDPDPPQRRAWVLTFGKHIVRPPNQTSGSAPGVGPLPAKKSWLRPWCIGLVPRASHLPCRFPTRYMHMWRHTLTLLLLPPRQSVSLVRGHEITTRVANQITRASPIWLK
jgi:hypothetical protein